MLGLPENSDLGKLLRWAKGRDLFTLVICHGPGALLAAADQGTHSIDKPLLDCYFEDWFQI